MKKYKKAEVAEFARLARELLLENGFEDKGGGCYEYATPHNTVYAVVDGTGIFTLSVFMRLEYPVVFVGETKGRHKVNFHSMPDDTAGDSAARFERHLKTVLGIVKTKQFFHQ